MMEQSRLYDLFYRYTAGTMTASEELELAALVIDPANEQLFQELEARYWEQLKDVTDPLPAKAAQSLQTILPGMVIPMRRKLVRLMAAASIVLLVGVGTYFFLHRPSVPPSNNTAELAKDVKAPETHRAMITLADGRQVAVDSLTTLTQNQVALTRNNDGRLVYSGSATAIIYNTLTNPRGSKVIDMQLADGSHVWLNAGSSVTYPVAFTGNERKVSISGEAYFEIAASPNPSEGGALRPFTVEKGDMQVQVLGTHFNVNAYEDEPDIKVTLLEGSVKVKSEVRGERSEVTIKPGQQAIVTHDSRLTTHNSPDLDQVMAWKNGQFYFQDADIETVMRQIARWYDLEVVYQSKPANLFRGRIPRNTNASNVLKILEETGGVHFKIEDKKVVVLP